MKKLLSLLVCMMVLFSSFRFCASAFAESAPQADGGEDVVFDFPEFGITMHLPAGTAGTLQCKAFVRDGLNPEDYGFQMLVFPFYPVNESRAWQLCQLFVVPDGCDFAGSLKEISKASENYSIFDEAYKLFTSFNRNRFFQKLGTADSKTYWFFTYTRPFEKELDERYPGNADELKSIMAALPEILAKTELKNKDETGDTGEDLSEDTGHSGEVWTNNVVFEFPEYGITMHLPEGTPGTVELMSMAFGNVTPQQYGFRQAEAWYHPAGNTDFFGYTLGTFFVVEEGRTIAEVLEEVSAVSDQYVPPLVDPIWFRELGKVGEDTVYFYDNPLRRGNPEYNFPDSVEEINRIVDALPEIVERIELGERVAPYSDLVGQTVSFGATDTHGNPVSVSELFSQHKITMINLWATWCGPCRDELHFLEEFSKTLVDKDCALIGLLVEGNDSSEAAEAASMVKSYGLSYPNLLPTDADWMENPIFKTREIPNTIFVDRDGKILCPPILGSLTSQYEKTLDSLLEQIK